MASATVASVPTAAISRSQSSRTLIRHLLRPEGRPGTKLDLRHYARGDLVVKRNRMKAPKYFRSSGSPRALLWLSLLYLENLPVFHDERNVLQPLDVVQWIAADRNDVGIGSRRNHPDLPFHVEHDRGARGGAVNCVHRLHAEVDHAREFLRDGLAPRDAAHVGAKHDLHPRL